MKKSLLSLAVIAVSLSAVTQHRNTISTGPLRRRSEQRLFITTSGTYDRYTGQSSCSRGKFKLTGSVAGLTPAFIVVEGQRGGDLIFVENADFTANLNLENPTASKIEGTAPKE